MSLFIFCDKLEVADALTSIGQRRIKSNFGTVNTWNLFGKRLQENPLNFYEISHTNEAEERDIFNNDRESDQILHVLKVEVLPNYNIRIILRLCT